MEPDAAVAVDAGPDCLVIPDGGLSRPTSDVVPHAVSPGEIDECCLWDDFFLTLQIKDVAYTGSTDIACVPQGPLISAWVGGMTAQVVSEVDFSDPSQLTQALCIQSSGPLLPDGGGSSPCTPVETGASGSITFSRAGSQGTVTITLGDHTETWTGAVDPGQTLLQFDMIEASMVLVECVADTDAGGFLNNTFCPGP
jgi:hypothetical protein